LIPITGTSRQGKGAEKREETEEDGRRKGGAPCKGRSAARVEENPSREVENTSRGVLWKRRPRRGAVIGAGVDNERGSGFVPGLQKVWRKRMSCRR